MMKLVENNPLFKEMAAYVEWHSSREKALNEEKEAVKEKYGWESEEMKAVQEKQKALDE